MKNLFWLILMSVSVNLSTTVHAGAISGGGPTERPMPGTASITFPDVGDARKLCEAGTSPSAVQAMLDAVVNAQVECKNQGYQNISDYAAFARWSVVEASGGVPSANCRADVAVMCW